MERRPEQSRNAMPTWLLAASILMISCSGPEEKMPQLPRAIESSADRTEEEPASAEAFVLADRKRKRAYYVLPSIEPSTCGGSECTTDKPDRTRLIDINLFNVFYAYINQ